MSLSLDVEARQATVDANADAGLQLIAQHWETVDADFEKHLLNYKERLNNLAAANPRFINSQTGKDYYSFNKIQY